MDAFLQTIKLTTGQHNFTRLLIRNTFVYKLLYANIYRNVYKPKVNIVEVENMLSYKYN